MDIKLLKLKLEQNTSKYIDNVIRNFPSGENGNGGYNSFRLDRSKEKYSHFESNAQG
mgnify:CR=1 FL=1